MGLKGPCALRTLRHFDVYRSFLSDTLHNLYSGAVVSDASLRILEKKQVERLNYLF